MNEYIKNLDPKEWEKFCGIILRYVFTAKNIWYVPDRDKGDLGIEFYSADGTIFQCYYPELNIDTSIYKNKVKKKIRKDLKKLITNKCDIEELLDGIKIKRWVLFLPELWSKDLIKYCGQQKKNIIEASLPYIDNTIFNVKIETPESYPDGTLFAQSIYGKKIDIPLTEISEKDNKIWQKDNTKFALNIKRKSDAIIGEKSDQFKDRVVKRYIQVEEFLGHLRYEHPDIHELIEDSARAQLEKMSDDASMQDTFDNSFIKKIIKNNEKAFSKHSEYLSDTNEGSLPMGYVSKWLAECYMDFKNDH